MCSVPSSDAARARGTVLPNATLAVIDSPNGHNAPWLLAESTAIGALVASALDGPDYALYKVTA